MEKENKELKTFLNCLHSCVDYWATVKLDKDSIEGMEKHNETEIRYRLDGLVHSILCLIDGSAGANDFHAYDLKYKGKTFNNCFMHSIYFERED